MNYNPINFIEWAEDEYQKYVDGRGCHMDSVNIILEALINKENPDQETANYIYKMYDVKTHRIPGYVITDSSTYLPEGYIIHYTNKNNEISAKLERVVQNAKNN